MALVDADGRAVTTTYDDAGRPTVVTRADASTLSWAYDAAGRVLTYTDAAGVETTYTYDAAGRRGTATDTAGRTTSYAYGPSGLLDTVTLPDGQHVDYAYDQVGRRTGVDYSDATPDVTYAYDDAGRATAMTDGTGTTAYSYDALGRPLEVARPGATVGYEYDVVGQLTALTYPTGEVVERAYDDVGQLTSVTDWADRDYGFDWTVDGQLEQVTYPNGVETAYDYDDAGQVLGITAASAAGLDMLALAYGYSDAGLLVDQGVTRSAEGRAPPVVPSTSASQYTWDPLGRVSEVTGAGAGTFAFDAAGSITALADGRALTYDAGRQLTAMTSPGVDPGPDVTTTFGYDARGNRATATTDVGASAGTVTHTFDLADRLTSVTGADGALTTYAYDGGGLRASATTGTGAGAVTEAFTWDVAASVPLLLTDAENAYVYGVGGTPLAQVALDDGAVEYLHTDLTGSVWATTDDAGQVTSESDYDVYGLAVAVAGQVRSGEVTRFGYAGEYADPTGYVYLRARYYDPATAQFLTRDPMVGVTGNPYGYTDGNPLQFTDPLGLDWYDEWEAGANHYAGRYGPLLSCEPSEENLMTLDDGSRYTVRYGLTADWVQAWCVNDALCIDRYIDKAPAQIGPSDWVYLRALRNLTDPVTSLSSSVATLLAELSGANCQVDDEQVMLVCTGASAGYRKGGTTFGNVFVTDEEPSDALMSHESKHADQWALFGGALFAPIYGISYAVQGECNVFEGAAGFDDGGYDQC